MKKREKLQDNDPFSPGEQYRLLVQVFDAKTEQEARDYIVRTFGEKKTRDAKIVKGTRRSDSPLLDEWKPSKNGFRAYVPKW